MKDITQLGSYKKVSQVNSLKGNLGVKKACAKVGISMPYYYKMNKTFSASNTEKPVKNWTKKPTARKSMKSETWTWACGAIVDGGYVFFKDIKQLKEFLA
jgi:hypothetical protein